MSENSFERGAVPDVIPERATWRRRIAGATAGRLRQRAAAGLVLAFAVLLVPTAADAYDLVWTNELTVPQSLHTDDLDGGVSCTDTAGNTFCVAVGEHDANGNAAAYKGTSTGTGAASITWTSMNMPGGADALRGVSCVNASTCLAVGAAGTIIRTTNGGSSWAAQTGTAQFLNAVSCTSALTCVAVGGDSYNLILRTTDGGANWDNRNAVPSAVPPTPRLAAISCPTSSTCVATSFNGRILRSDDGGLTWAAQSSPPSYDLLGVSCTSSTSCVAVDNGGFILRYASGTWTIVATANDSFNSVSCSGLTCYAAGYRGLHMSSSDGGVSWVSQVAPATDMYGVSCTPTRCRTVGTLGTDGTPTYGGGAIEKI